MTEQQLYGPKAIELISELLRLADKNNCNITVNIHLNRSGEKSNLRGWLGSMLLQKAFEVFNCAKVFKTDAMQNCAMMGYDELKARVMKLGNILKSSYYETVFAMAEEQGFVKKTQDRNLRVVVVMPPAG